MLKACPLYDHTWLLNFYSVKMVHLGTLTLFPLLALATPRWSNRVQDSYGGDLPVAVSDINVGVLSRVF